MQKKSLLIILTFLSCSVFSQVVHNSERFEVKNFLSLDESGNYSLYQAHGFVENTGNSSRPRIFLMPVLEFDLHNIEFFSSQGYQVSPNSSDVYSINIPITSDLSLPNESEKVAIAASLNSGEKIEFYRPQMIRNTMGGYAINPVAGNYTPQITSLLHQYEQILAEQQKYIQAFNNYDPEIITPVEYGIEVSVGGQIVYDRSLSGSFISIGDFHSEIAIDEPSSYIKNRIANGNFTILVTYKFRDAKVGYIDAKIDAKLIVDQFLSEAQTSTVKQKSKGWSFLGFGSRKKSIKSSFDQQIKQQYNTDSSTNTVVEMNDADDDMIEMFENAFFPTLAKQKVIDNHREAAQKASASGDSDLQQLHLDYVKALQENNPDLEANIGEAVAALGKKDYVGFIAHGVRWGDRQASGNSSFRRVLNSEEMTEMSSEWSQTKKVSVLHSVTQKVSKNQALELKPYIGMATALPFNTILPMRNGFFVTNRNVKGLFTGPVTELGPLAMNNIPSGTPITRVAGQPIEDLQDLQQILDQLSPGDRIALTVIESVAPNQFKEKDIVIELGSFPATD